MKLAAAGQTDTGRVREHNEDNLLLIPEYGLFAVADGMGGELAGEVASRMALDALWDYYQRAADGGAPIPADLADLPEETARLVGGIRQCNRIVHDAGQVNPAWRNMGTTIVAASVSGRRLTVAHVGDSRCYLLRDDAILQLTDDHSLVAEQVRMGLMTREEAATSRMRNVITRALGALPEVVVDVSEHPLRSGDRILLCSDGLTNMVSEAEIVAVAGRAESLDEACATLVAGANRRGGRDNITLVLVAVLED